ncbi:hypothetical protein Mkiyose1384_39540 [Mycobacterium kiyosense]|nr:hypothetical protein IWGMT90018_16750 [Mycobacterium kiyosense]GLB96708.1 hypothetical protein SRL2020226_34840 [Mycobacterium kiyosense]GLD08557.1 hypothetical protein Mkiyose1383_48830 [Mycobacterium kiyosense]GLD13730.1 hypothetical protein Mkiyose1384_39540 [Mycobacterium kiyosense]GLD19674.1 hypothetical protein Mkiyose1385_37730 [Mycobacterium kiyosense]
MDFMYLVENLTEEGLLIAAMTAAVMGPVLNDTIAYTTDRKTFRNAHHAYSARPSLLADLANRGDCGPTSWLTSSLTCTLQNNCHVQTGDGEVVSH